MLRGPIARLSLFIKKLNPTGKTFYKSYVINETRTFLVHCPFCMAEDTKVIDSRLVAGGRQVRRRRECADCGERVTTYETVELVMPRVIKQDGTREPFDLPKLRGGILKALEKRAVPTEKIEEAIQKIQRDIRILGEREVSSRTIGEAVVNVLRDLDEVAYVRFASVYRSFKDLSEFLQEIEQLERERPGSSKANLSKTTLQAAAAKVAQPDAHQAKLIQKTFTSPPLFESPQEKNGDETS